MATLRRTAAGPHRFHILRGGCQVRGVSPEAQNILQRLCKNELALTAAMEHYDLGVMVVPGKAARGADPGIPSSLQPFVTLFRKDMSPIFPPG